MKVIIAGSRDLNPSKAEIEAALADARFTVTEVVSGTARGVDRAGEQFATAFDIAVKRFPADWDVHGKRAGYLRNEEMAKYADALLAFWDGESKGTAHMIRLAHAHGIKVHVVSTNGGEAK